MAVKKFTGKNQLLAIFGGTFDPIHLGHLQIVKKLRRLLKVDQIILIPCNQSALREPPMISAEHRMQLARLATKNLKYTKVDAREINNAKISYSFDTLRTLRAENPHASLALVMGMDAFNNFDKWKKFRQILQLAHLIIVDRPKVVLDPNPKLKPLLTKHLISDPQGLRQKNAGTIFFLSIAPLPIAATNIRCLLKQQQSAKKLLPAHVWEYTKKHNLLR